METFIPSTLSPAGCASSASYGTGGQAAPADAAGSDGGMFLQVLTDSCASQTNGTGEYADAPMEGQGEDAVMDDSAPAGEETAGAESVIPAVLFFAAEPPVVAQEAPAGAEGTASGEVSPAGYPVDPAAVFSVSAYIAARSGADAPAAAGTATSDIPVSIDESSANGSVLAERSGTASGQAAASVLDIPAAEQVAASAFDVAVAEQAAAFDAASAAADGSVVSDRSAAAAKDVPASGKAAASAFDVAAAVAAAADRSAASGPSAAAAKGVTAAGQEGLAAEPEGNPAQGRVVLTADAPREVEPPAARDASGGKPSLASEEGGSGSFSSADAGEWESALAGEAPEGLSAESASRAQEPANPAASPAVAAGRDVAETASAQRTGPPEPTAQASKSFQVGENAFVLTRKSDTSVEVTLSPPGVGKLELEISVDKGVVTANITAADPAGREAIERSLPQIVQALENEGMSIGGFTVSLKQGNGQDGNAQAGGASGNASAKAPVLAAVRSAAASSGLVDIFV